MDEREQILRRAAVYLLLVIIASRVAAGAWHVVSDLVIMTVTALFLSFAIDPAVSWFERRGARRGLGTITVLGAVVFSIGALLAAAGAVLVSQAGELADSLPAILTDAIEQTNRLLGLSIDPVTVLGESGFIQKLIDGAQDAAVTLGQGVLENVGKVLMILFLTFYLSADATRITHGICSLLRPSSQLAVQELIDTARQKTGSYLATRAILAGMSSMSHIVLFMVLGVPYAIPLGLWVGVVSQVIPVIGTYLAASLPVVVALGSFETTRTALLVVVGITVYQQLENNVISPRVTRATMRLHPIVGLLSIVIGSRLAGVAGALFAIPAAASVSSILGLYVTRHEVHGPVAKPSEDVEEVVEPAATSSDEQLPPD